MTQDAWTAEVSALIPTIPNDPATGDVICRKVTPGDVCQDLPSTLSVLAGLITDSSPAPFVVHDMKSRSNGNKQLPQEDRRGLHADITRC